ncbi:hypothetical protein NDU88_006589 [Pleurodeles waltl]|uniref:Uncharacterized protein n=1 Tax=Pleurodeles waltl TaxID=8319 RepID=A0AAV7RLV8_PLEWA|nr:hypothetical protein NDU88_006589 [Pleurodeles waltl]
MCETVLAEVAQRSPTSPETNLESRAMQVRVPWTQAWLCTKDFRRKCTGAGVAAKSQFPAMQPSEVRQGLTSTKLGLKSYWTVRVTWTELLDSRDLARRAERRPKGPVMQLFGACGCRGKIPSTHGSISSELLVQRGGRLPPQHAQAGKQSRRRQDQRYRVAVVVFATMLQVCRLPARSAVDSLSEGEERDAEELG